MFALYVALYSLVRLPLETMKVDPADHIFGQRFNVWVAATTLVIGTITFVILFRRRKPEPVAAVSPTAVAAVSGHTPTPRPEAAIAARQRTQRRKKP